MGKKKIIRKPGGRSEKHAHSPVAKTVRTKKTQVPGWIIPVILIVTFIAFFPVFNAGFVNWDDSDYVVDNILIKDPSRLGELLTAPLQGNYHPITMLSLAINHMISGEEAWSYHLFNLLFHLINCILVFRLVFLLSNKNLIISFVTALFFGIHPMHVESVAWISERKDVLYGLFFLLGLISYTKYVDNGSKKQYWLTFLFLVLSVLSKPAAAIFPIVLFCIDILRKRKFSLPLITEKILFFIPAIAIGILTIMAQQKAGATGEDHFGLAKTILFGFYGIMMYVVKMVLPFRLSPFYPYPALNEQLPATYYIAPVFFLILAAIFFISYKRYRLIAFGILFYLVNLALVLQVLTVGSAVIADRYTYIPYIGLFIIIGWLIDRFAKGNITKAGYIFVPLTIFFSILTFRQTQVWKNGAALWDHTIKVHPSSKAYANRAILLRREKNLPLAVQYYSQAIKMNKIDFESHGNLGNVYFDLKNPDSAFFHYRQSLSIKPDYVPALDNIGAMFASTGQYDSALKYLNKALEIKPEHKPAYSNRALVYMTLNRYEDALKDWESFLRFEPDAADVYNSIGVCYQNMGKYNESLTAINKAISLAPQPMFYINRSYSYYALNNLEQARADALKAQQAGQNIPVDLAAKLGLQ